MISIDYIKQPGWQKLLSKKKYSASLARVNTFIKNEQQSGKVIFPAQENVFQALNLCPIDKTKVIILGQDPYHNTGQAQGLSFSVPSGLKIPPSLANIYKELKSDLNIQNQKHGNLSDWAAQGVLLLNAILTVNQNEPASHHKAGWEFFTDELLKDLSDEREHLVFLLWGKFAQAKSHLIDAENHLILEAAHPSPFSAYRGFFGCEHFSKANRYLTKHHKGEIDWRI